MERFRLIPATHVLLIRDNLVFLIRRFNTGYEDGKYCIPGGHLEGDEPVLDATIREAREETGVDINPADLKFACVMHRRSTEERIDFFFLCEKWTGEPANVEPERSDHSAWFPLDQLPENLVPYCASAINNYLSNTALSQYGWSN